VKIFVFSLIRIIIMGCAQTRNIAISMQRAQTKTQSKRQRKAKESSAAFMSVHFFFLFFLLFDFFY